MSATEPRSEADLIGLFKTAARKISDKELGELRASDKITELGLDSIELLEVIGCLEDELEFQFPDEELASIQTLENLVAAAAKLLAHS